MNVETPDLDALMRRMARNNYGSANLPPRLRGRPLPTEPVRRREWREQLYNVEPFDESNLEPHHLFLIWELSGQIYGCYLTNDRDGIREQQRICRGTVAKYCKEANLNPSELLTNAEADIFPKVFWLMAEFADDVLEEMGPRNQLGNRENFYDLLDPYVRLFPNYPLMSWIEGGITRDVWLRSNLDNLFFVPVLIATHLINLMHVVKGHSRLSEGRYIETENYCTIKQKHAEFVVKIMDRLGHAYANNSLESFPGILEDIHEKFNSTLDGLEDQGGFEYPRVYENPSPAEVKEFSAILGSMYDFANDLFLIVQFELPQQEFAVADFYKGLTTICPPIGATSWRLYGGVSEKEAMKAFLDAGVPFFSFPYKWDEELSSWTVD